MEPNALPAVAAGRLALRRRRGASRGLRLVIVGVPILLVGLVAVLLGLRWWLDRFLHSEEFRRRLDLKASTTLRAQSHFGPLRWQGSEVYSAGLEAKGGVSSPWMTFEADEIRSVFNLRALWHRVWRVETLNVERIVARLASGEVRPDDSSPDRNKVSQPGADDHFLTGLLPGRVEIGEVRVADLTLKWPGGSVGEAGQIQGVRLNARPSGDLSRWEIDGRGGKLTQGGFPPVALDQFSLKSGEGEIFITRATGHPETGGRIECSGTQALVDDKKLDLHVSFDGLPVETFLPPDWRTRLHGKTTGDAHVSGSQIDAGSWRTSGHIELREGSLEALPVMNELAIFTSTVRYRQAVVHRGSADYAWSPDGLKVQNVVLESEGLLRLEGGFTVRQEQIEGQFRVGVAMAALRWLPGAGTVVFNEPQRDGYVWTTMHVSGPVRNPHEDLTARLAGAVEQEVARKAKQGADAVIDTANDLLNLIRPR